MDINRGRSNGKKGPPMLDVLLDEPGQDGVAHARMHMNAAASNNSFSDQEMQRTPRGSVHTNKNNQDGDEASQSTPAGLRPPALYAPVQFSQKSHANNKIRVVIRMRPYLHNEQEMLLGQIKAQSQGNLRLESE